MSFDQHRVHIDARTADDVFTAWTDPEERWNGFATPAFDRAQAERVVAWLQRDEQYVGTWEGDSIVLTPVADADFDGGPERYEPDQHGRYHIGSWAWTWMILEPEAPDDPAELTAWLVAEYEELKTRIGGAKLRTLNDRRALLERTSPASPNPRDLVMLGVIAAAEHAEDLTGIERNVALGMAVSIIEALITHDSPAAADLIGVQPVP